MKTMMIVIAVFAATATSRDATLSRTPADSTAAGAAAAEKAARVVGAASMVHSGAIGARRLRDSVESRLAVANTHIRFLAVDLVIDSKEHPLAVYQVEFTASPGVTIVGLEGGGHDPFREAPYFDPAAIQHERVIVAAFSTAGADKLPRGKVRVATIHLQVTGDADPRFNLKPSVIATIDGKAIDATATVETKRTQS